MFKTWEKQALFLLQFPPDASMSTGIHTASDIPDLTSTQLRNICQALDTQLNSTILLLLWHGQEGLLQDRLSAT